MARDTSEKCILEYTALIAAALASRGPHINVYEAFLALLTMAARTVAVLEPAARSEICEIVEENFRDDVESLAEDEEFKNQTFRMQ